ncbi:hypothetical protein pb186bvf_020540 [Paramecium bursaria]
MTNYLIPSFCSRLSVPQQNYLKLFQQKSRSFKNYKDDHLYTSKNKKQISGQQKAQQINYLIYKFAKQKYKNVQPISIKEKIKKQNTKDKRSFTYWKQILILKILVVKQDNISNDVNFINNYFQLLTN